MERSSRYKESKVQRESMYTVLCCCCSVTECCSTLWDPMDCSTQAPLSFTVSQSLLKLVSIKLVMLSNHLILLSPSPLALNLPQH